MKKRPLGPAIGLIRRRAGVSQTDLARRIDWPSQQVSKTETAASMNTTSLFLLLDSLGANLVDLHEALTYAEYLSLAHVPRARRNPLPVPEAEPAEAVAEAQPTAQPSRAGSRESRRHPGVPVLGSEDWWQRAAAALEACRRPSPVRQRLQHRSGGTEPPPEALRVALQALGFAHVPAEKEAEAFRVLRFAAHELAFLNPE